MTSSVLGRPVWYELMTSDIGAAERFYHAVIGWTAEPFENSPNPYAQLRKPGGGYVGGLLKTPEGMSMPPFWAMYLAVPQLEAAIASIQRHGGRELSPVVPIPTVGRIQMVSDPHGAAFYVIEPEPRDNPPDQPLQTGDASWLELRTSDGGAGMRFYADVFGWHNGETLNMGERGDYLMFNRDGGRMLGGVMTKPADMGAVPPHWMIYFKVDDINAATARVTANGGQVLFGPMEVPGGDLIINAVDPQGAMFALHEAKRG